MLVASIAERCSGTKITIDALLLQTATTTNASGTVLFLVVCAIAGQEVGISIGAVTMNT